MVILWLRFGDWLGSRYRLASKAARGFWKFGAGWRDKTRTGRVYSRLEHIEFESSGDVNAGTFREIPEQWRIRPEPGWAWSCQNCKTFSFVTESMMVKILEEWDAEAQRILARGYKPGRRPTTATAPCPNCRYRPGAPE